jgi:MATE family multidrug resistance protein
MAFFGLLFWLVPDLFLACFNSDAAIRDLGRELLWVAAVFQVFDAVAMVAVGSLNGVGDTRWTMAVSVAANWLVMIPLALWLGMGLKMGALGAWLAITADVLVVGGVLLLRFYREGWRRVKAAVPAGTAGQAD